MKKTNKAYSVDVYVANGSEIKQFGMTTTNKRKAEIYYYKWSLNENVVGIEWEELD